MYKLLLTILLFWVTSGSSQTQSADLKIIKGRMMSDLLSTPIQDYEVKTIMTKMKADGSFQDINYTDLSRTAGFPQGNHTRQLAYLAKAYKNSKSTYYQNQQVKDRIINGLTYWVKNDFVGDNWHNNQITTPTYLIEVMLAIGDELPKDLIGKAQPMIGRANMEASGARPSGDRIVIAGLLAKNLLFVGDAEGFDKIIKIIEGEMKFATGERGIQQDFSFHHRTDRVNNTTSYGYGKYANAYGEWAHYVAGTKYAFSKEKIDLLVDYYLDGICKQLVYGVYEDISVKNRSITNKTTFHPQATLEIERLLPLTNYRKKELEEIINLRKGTVKPSQSFAKFFWQTEHFVFQRPNFYTTVRMYSTRNRNMEEPYNGPGKTTHHRADGTNYLQLNGDEYHNMWAVYDWQKISGTTIVQKPQLPGPDQIQKEGLTDFVGAVTDGLYGAVAFDFLSPHDMLKAKKSWFFFDEEYVCLGSRILPSTNMPVVTTINQVLMNGKVTTSQEGDIKELPSGDRLSENVKWVFHDKIGYLFPTPTAIHISNQAETGRWSDITDEKNISTDLVSQMVFKLWFDHGNQLNAVDIHGKRIHEAGASYQYIVVPDVTEQQLKESSSNNRNIEILANNGDVQAVKHTKLNLLQMTFYKAGTVEVSPGIKVKMDSQGMAMLKMKGARVTELSASDPSRKLGKLIITLPGIYTTKGEGFVCLPNVKNNQTAIILDMPQGVYAGKSVTVKF